jgi:ABC-type branched-subunit amino acid transport system substrate-binding protein
MKKNNKLVTGLVAIAVIVIIVISLNGSNGKQADSINIGVITSLTGLISGGDNLGQGFANGITLAKEEYAKAHPEKKINVFIEDDNFDSKKGASAYQKLVSINKIDTLINLSSPTIDVISKDVHDSGMLTFQLGAESDPIADNIYQIYPDQTSIGVMGDVANKDEVKKVVIAMQQFKAYEKFVSDFTKTYKGEVEIQRISTSEKDMSSIALKIKESNPDGLLIFMEAKDGAKLVRKLKDFNAVPKHMYFDINLQFGINDYKDALGGLSTLNGSKSLYSAAEMTKEFQEKYKVRFNQNVSMLSGFGYDAYMTAINLYDKDQSKWKSNIEKYKAMGVTGEIRFNDVGMRPPQFKIGEIINGELTVK